MISEAAFDDETEILYGEIDLERCEQDRIRLNTAMRSPLHNDPVRVRISSSAPAQGTLNLVRSISSHPFVPADSADRSRRCHEIRAIQASGLAQRLRKIHCSHLVLGISGGLDSTLALIIAAEAFRMNGLPLNTFINYICSKY